MYHTILIKLEGKISRIVVCSDSRIDALAFARTAFPDAEMIK